VSKSFFSREEISGPPFYLTWLFPSFLSLIWNRPGLAVQMFEVY
jgi:hypothetical protein